MNKEIIKDDEVNLIALWNVLMSKKKLIAAIVIVCTLLSIVYSFLVTKQYTSEAIIMPIAQSSGGLPGGLSSLAGLAGINVSPSQTPSQKMMALLHTKYLARQVIVENGLLPVFFGDIKSSIKGSIRGSEEMLMQIAVQKVLGGFVNFEGDENKGTIKISSTAEDPKLAMTIVDSYVRNLQKYLNDNSITVAKRNRIFIEGQLEQNKRELLEAGKMLNAFYKGERISNIESKIDVPLASETTNVQLNELQRQKNELDQKINEIAVIKDVPQQVYLQYLNLRRTLLSQVNSLLTQQYVMAKISESKEDVTFQVIDPPQVPEIRSWPKRKLIVVVSFMGSFFLAIFVVFFMEFIKKLKSEQIK